MISDFVGRVSYYIFFSQKLAPFKMSTITAKETVHRDADSKLKVESRDLLS